MLQEQDFVVSWSGKTEADLFQQIGGDGRLRQTRKMDLPMSCKETRMPSQAFLRALCAKLRDLIVHRPSGVLGNDSFVWRCGALTGGQQVLRSKWANAGGPHGDHLGRPGGAPLDNGGAPVDE